MTTEIAIPLPQWDEKRKRRYFVTSATQHETFGQLCKRKWWLKNVRKLPEIVRAHQVFGTVLHQVAERYVSADDLGRDANGNPVDLFPPGWEVAKGKFGQPSEGSCNPVEQQLIRKLVAKAIEEGILERLPGRLVEDSFRITVIESEGDGSHVQLSGFIDLYYVDPPMVIDHKTVKTMKYAKSENALKKDTQMLTYAKRVLEQRRSLGLPDPPSILLQHNAYCKDPNNPVIRRTRAEVTVQQVEDAWVERQAEALEMDLLRDRINSWSEIPDPINKISACQAYGGCSYQPICQGRESEKGYEQRLASGVAIGYTVKTEDEESGANVASDQSNKEISVMGNSFLESLRARKAAVGAPAAAPIAAAAPAQAPTQAPAQAPAQQPAAQPAAQAPAAVQAPAPAPVSAVKPEGDVPPWAVPTCAACGKSAHPGFNSSANPCRICATQRKLGKDGIATIQPDHFNIQTVDGFIMWSPKPEYVGVAGYTEGATTVPQSAAPAVSVSNNPAPVQQPAAPAQAPAQAPAAAPVTQAPAPVTQTPAQAPAQTPAQPAKEEQEPAGNKGGAPKKGFALLINCIPATGHKKQNTGRYVHDLINIFAEVQKDMAKQNGVESFYDLDVWKRRDALAKAAPIIAEGFGADMVMALSVPSSASDYRALVEALIPLAGMVIVNQAAS